MEKYLLLGNLDEILEKLNPHSNQSGTGKKALGNSLDFLIRDGLVWVSIGSLSRLFGFPLGEWLMMDGVLDAMNSWAEEIGVFPVMEL